MIPESFIQELLNRVDIVEMINKVVPLKKTGKNYDAVVLLEDDGQRTGYKMVFDNG